MLRVPIKQARQGMTLALPVQHPARPGTVLLRAGATLESRTIERLGEIHCPEVWIRYPKLEFIEQYINTESMEAKRRVTKALAEAFDGITSCAHAKLDYPRYLRSVVALLMAIRQKPRAALFLNEMGAYHRPMLRHSSNVCVLSLLVGLKLDFYLVRERPRLSPSMAQDVTSLGVAGLMHDIGMLGLGDDLLSLWEGGADEEDPMFAEHVAIGRHMLRGHVDPVATSGVLHHHQHFDGSGFPRKKARVGKHNGLEGGSIHVFARILTACDLFDRLSYPETPNEGAPPPRPEPAVRTLNKLLQPPYSDWIDPMILRGLMAVVPPYGPGTLVELSDGSQAVVTDWDRAEPCRPTVTLIPDLREPSRRSLSGLRDDEDEPGETIDLQLRPELCIRCVGDSVVEHDNFYADDSSGFDINAAARSMLNRADELEKKRRAG